MYNHQDISVLIIEDNPGDQVLLKEYLQGTNLTFDTIALADNLADALTQIQTGNFSLIFLDLFLPDSSGLQSFTELEKTNPRVPIIIYSGVADSPIALKALGLGAQDFLIKGEVTVPLLERAIRYSIERKHNIDALEKSIDKYNLISKATHDMVWDWNVSTGEIYRNLEGWKKIFKAEVVDEAEMKEEWSTKVHEDDRERVQKIIMDAINSPATQVFEAEFRIIRGGNSVGYLIDRGYIIRNEEGRAIRLIGASHDITERKMAEQKVLESERRFKSLVQNGSDLLAILDVNGKYTYVSPTSKNILGFEPEYFSGKSAFEFIHPDDIEKTSEALATAASERFVTVPPFRFKNASGAWRWIESTITNLLDDPAVKGIVVNSRDVTDRKNADDEIKKLSIVAQETINGIIISDTDQKITWVNAAFTKMFGYTLNEVIGKDFNDFLTGLDTDRDLIAEMQIQKKHSREPFSFEMLSYTKSGTKKFISVLIQPIFDQEGNFEQSFAIQTDITEKKLAEEELKKLSIIAKETVNGVVIRDINQRILWVNQGFTKMTGYELKEVLGKRPVDFLTGEESDMSIQSYIDEQRASNNTFTYEILNYKKNGEKFYVRIQDQSIFNEAGEVIQYMAIQTDITQEKQIQEEIASQKVQKQREITEAVYAAQENERSEIGREMHDNVTQLLGASRLYIDMAKTNEEERESLLMSASRYTLNAIDEIRKLSKTLITPFVKEKGLVESVNELAADIMHVHPLKIILTTENFKEEELEDKFKLNIFRILQEQINNIIKHAQAGIIQIGLYETNGRLIFSVRDDGIGFDTSARKTGVGITNIKSRSELYNGVVELTSVIGKGTSLKIGFNKGDIAILNTI